MTEAQIHAAILAYLRRVLPDAIVHHSPNSMDFTADPKTKAIAQNRNKARGMLPGFPDLLIFHDGIGYCLEIKKEGGRLSDVQKLVKAQLERACIPYAVVRSVEDVRETLNGWNIKTTEAQKLA